MNNSQQLDAVVIGAGQAGLAAGYHLAKTRLQFEILEADPRVGDIWRRRWDSLRLFTPAQHDGLPGLPFPGARNTFPGKEDFAAYLESYAARFGLPVRTGVRVTGVRRAGAGFAVDTAAGTVRAHHVIVATGANALPRLPDAAAGLDPAIRQLHSSQYRSPADIPDGDVLVVGAGTSGSEIALELSASRRVLLAGRPTPHIPDPLLRYAGDVYWRFIHHVLTLRTPIGRRVAVGFHQRGAPLVRISAKDLDRAGVIRVPRLTGTAGGQPTFDGRQFRRRHGRRRQLRRRADRHLGDRLPPRPGMDRRTAAGGVGVAGNEQGRRHRDARAVLRRHAVPVRPHLGPDRGRG